MTCPICNREDCKSVAHAWKATRGAQREERKKAKLLANHRKYSHTDKGKETRSEVTKRRRQRVRDTGVNLPPEEWQATLEHFGNKCCYCGGSGVMHRDHFLPVVLGGTMDRHNTVPACKSCNASKKDAHPLEWLMGKNKLADYVRIFNYLTERTF